MKKLGFTLAEVLVVLGIIGVVAALTLPSLTANTANAQIGPKLAKAVAMFDQANAALLSDMGVDSLADTNLLEQNADPSYQGEIIKHLKATEGGSIDSRPNDVSGSNSLAIITAKDGTVYEAYSSGASSSDDPAHMTLIGTVVVDIDGKGGPGKAGTDIFAFTWFADGSIRPYGGTGSKSGYDWEKLCPKPVDGGEKTVPGNYWACAGHVLENNLKVQYE